MKKFVNDPKAFVPEMLKGIALANPDTIKYVPEYNLIMRADAPRDRCSPRTCRGLDAAEWRRHLLAPAASGGCGDARAGP